MQGVSEILAGCDALLQIGSQVKYSIDVKEACDELIKSRDELIHLRKATRDYNEEAVEAQKKVVLKSCREVQSALRCYDSACWRACEVYERVETVQKKLYDLVFENRAGANKMIALIEYKVLSGFLERLQYVGAELTHEDFLTLTQIEQDVKNDFKQEVQ